MEPVEGTLVFNPFPANIGEPQWTVCTPEYQQCTAIKDTSKKGESLPTVSPAQYQPFFPAVSNAAQGGLMDEFVAVFSQALYTQQLPPEVIFYDLTLMQQNVINTSSIQAKRVAPFVTTVGTMMYAVGGELLGSANDGPLTALSDSVQLAPSVVVDMGNANLTYHVGDVIEGYTADGCHSDASRLQLATGPDCQTQVPGTNATACGNPFKFPTAQIVLPANKVLHAYVCHSKGTCAVHIEDRQPCSLFPNATDDDCRWSSCCWDNVAKQCFNYGIAGDSTRESTFWSPVWVSMNLDPLKPLRISNRPSP